MRLLPNLPEMVGTGNTTARNIVSRHRQGSSVPSGNRVTCLGPQGRAAQQGRPTALAPTGWSGSGNSSVLSDGLQGASGLGDQVSSHHFSVSLHPAGCPLATPSSKHTAHVDPSSAKQASNRALPDELLQLADASAPILLPTSSSVPAGSLDNRQLDKLVGTLGRNKATWRRAVVLLQWLQDIGHVLDDRLCTTLIRVCSEHAHTQMALSVYDWMKGPPAVGGAGLAPTVYTYTAAMRAALAAGLLDRALQVWEDAQAASCPLDCRLCITFIEVSCRKGLTDQALAMYDTMRAAPKGSKLSPTVHAYTAAMRAATEGGCWQKALDIWQDMTAAGVLPTGHAFAAAMSACAAGSNWQQAVALFEDMCHAGIKPDVVSCTALISALAAAGQWQRSESVVQWMLSSGVRPNVRTYTALLTALGNARQWDRAVEMLRLMQQSSWGGVTPNSYTYSALLRCLGECGEWQRAEALFATLEQQALSSVHTSSVDSSSSSSSALTPAAEKASLEAATGDNNGWQASSAAATGTGGVNLRRSALDAEVIPGVWGWQAASGRQGLIQRPAGHLDCSSSSSGGGGTFETGGSCSSSDVADAGQQGLWTSASQLHGLDLNLQHDATGGNHAPTSSGTSSSSSSVAGSVCSGGSGQGPAATAVASSLQASQCSGSVAPPSTTAPVVSSSSNMLTQQLAQLALQQQLAASMDLQLLLFQQQHYHQTQMTAAAQQAAALQQQQQQLQQAVVVPTAQQQQQQRRKALLGPGPVPVATTPGVVPAAPAATAGRDGTSTGCVVNEAVVSSMMLAYERAGKWQEAVGALGRAAALGVSPSSAMFNTAILAAGKAGQLAVADALFGQARASSVADAATYEAMVAVYGMAGDHQRAEVVLRGMQAAGLSPGEYAYCGLIAAYSLAGDAAAALRVRGRMTKAGCQPGAHTYNALIAAADRAAMFDKALDFLRSMKREGVEANALTQQLAADIGRKGAATVEGQQLTAAALSAAMAAAGTLLMRSGVF